MRPYRSLAPLLLVAGISACSDGGGSGTPSPIGPIYCAALTGGTATAGAVCAGGTCEQNFKDAAADRDLDTYAVLEMNQSSGNVNIRVTAADGVTYPGGTPAAVVYGVQRDGESLNTAETITTYLDGAVQETGNANTGFGATSDDLVAGRRAIGTTMDFDAIEYTYTQSGGTGTVEVHVHEFCTSVSS